MEKRRPENSASGNVTDEAPMSRPRLLMFAVASGVMIANAYYIHPLIDPVAGHFGIGAAQIGFAPALNQIALAIGILLLLPLGDLVSNRKLVITCVTAQFVMVAGMAFAPSYAMFLAASALLGFFTIAPYVVPAYVSRRVPQSMLGEVNGILTTGVIIGILCARGIAGVIGEYFGWQMVYKIATAIMLLTAIAMPLLMRDDSHTAAQRTGKPRSERQSDGIFTRYWQLIASIWPLAVQRPEMLRASLVQGLNFGIFIAIWLGLGLHLPGPEMGYGVDVIGYLALLAIVNLFSTTLLGRWADRMGADRARLYVAVVQFSAVLTLPWSGYSLWLLVPVLLITNIAGPVIDIAGRMTLLSEPADIRTRLLTIYIVAMFTGGGLASWAATSAYAIGQWPAVSLLTISISAGVLALSWQIQRQHARS